jgi:hypothetical protein
MAESAKENCCSAPLLLIHHQEQSAGIQMRNQELSDNNIEEGATLYTSGK